MSPFQLAWTPKSDAGLGGRSHCNEAPNSKIDGASGGAAAKLDRRCCSAALGYATNGGVTVPSAQAGLVSLRFGRGKVPLTGTAPLARTFDSYGPIGVNVIDVAILYHALLGAPTKSVELSPFALQGVRIGVPRRVFRDYTKTGADARTAPPAVGAEYDAALGRAVDQLRQLGATVTEADLELDEWLALDQADRDAVFQADFADALPKWIETLAVNPNEIRTVGDLLRFTERQDEKTDPEALELCV